MHRHYDSHCDFKFNKSLGDKTLEIRISEANESADNIHIHILHFLYYLLSLSFPAV